MQTINASTIHTAILAAAAVAPEYRVEVSHSWEMQQRAAHFLTVDHEEAQPDYDTKWAIREAAALASEAALSELCYAEGWQPPKFVTFQTSARGSMRILNTRARLEEFAAQVKASQRAFGGGIKPQARAKPAQSWSPATIKAIRNAFEDRDYAGALQLAEEKAGALFYPTTSGHRSVGGASMLLLVAPVDVPELPGLVTAYRANDGAYVVMDTRSGCSVGMSGGSRSTAIRNALRHMEQRKVTVESIAGAIARAVPVDQAKARADFVAHFKIADLEEAGRMAAEAVARAQESAAEQCAEVAA